MKKHFLFILAIFLLSILSASCSGLFVNENIEEELILFYNNNSEDFNSIKNRFMTDGLNEGDIIDIDTYKFEINTITDSSFHMEIMRGPKFGIGLWNYVFFLDFFPSDYELYEELWSHYSDLTPYSYGYRYLANECYLALESPNMN